MSNQIKNYIKSNRGTNRYSRIRQLARLKTSTRQQICFKCGYDKHVETCHIKPIHNFSVEATIDDVNADANLILLCPNCHWEHDFLERKNNLQTKKTCTCGQIKYEYAKSCRKCESKKRTLTYPRKVQQRPSLEELNILLLTMPMTAIGKKYGVSDNCIRKWISKYKSQN